MAKPKCPCPFHCKYCGRKRSRDCVGHYCKTVNCTLTRRRQWNSTLPAPSAPMKRGKPMNRVSPRQRAAQAAWAAVCAVKLVRCHGLCEASIEGICDGPGAELFGHHFLPRSQGGKNKIGNCLMLCRSCHRLVHDNPALAASMGLIASAKYATEPVGGAA